MENETTSFWQKHFWGRPVRFFSCLILCLLLVFFILDYNVYHVTHSSNWSDFTAFTILALISLIFIASVIGLILSAIPKTQWLTMWVLRRWLFCAAALITLTALFYAEEDWRGKRAWEKCKHELEAKGVDLNWDNYIPPAVPDEQNFFKAPKMQQWFVGRGTAHNDFIAASTNENTRLAGSATNKITTEAQAREYLAWSDQLAPQLDLLRNALKRPYARMDGDYSRPTDLPIPNFVTVREVARIQAQRAHCYFLLHQPDAALQQLSFIHDTCRLLLGAPTGKPMTLVAAMINVAVTGLYADTIAEGFRMHVWQEPQLEALQQQLNGIRLIPPVAEAFRGEELFFVTTLERSSRRTLAGVINMGTVMATGSEQVSFLERVKHGELFFAHFAPKGWLYQNMTSRVKLTSSYIDRVDPLNDFVLPGRQKEMDRTLDSAFRHTSVYNFLVAMLTPNFSRATQRMAYNQNQANMALIVCALERYHLANNQYPESLSALTPQFIEKLPHDIINGGDLKYHRAGDSFVLYSIGWNEKDDGGTQASPKNGNVQDLENGDWVWPNFPR